MDFVLDVFTNKTLLIVDDDPANIRIITSFLKDLDLNIKVATGGVHALEIANEHEIDMVWLDVKMHDMDGFEVCRRLKQEDKSKDVPVVFVSALSNDESKLQGFQAGGADYVTKPFYRDEIIARLRTHLSLGDHLKNERRIRSFLAASIDAIVSMDESQQITEFNTAAERIFGYSAEEIIGQPVTVLMPEEEAANHAGYVHSRKEKADPTGISIRDVHAVRKNGEHFPVEISVSEIVMPWRRWYTAIIRDITKRKILERQHKAALSKLAAHSKMASIGELATGIAHEINQPLTFISGVLQVLRRDLKKDKLKVESVLEDINEGSRQINRINEIVDHMRTFGRKKSEMTTFVDMTKVVKNVQTLVHKSINDSKIEVHIGISKDLPAVKGNATHLEQVLINLFQNSIFALKQKFESGGGEINITLEVEEGELKLVFSDNGEGIAPEQLKKIYEPFWTSKAVGEGTGLGLSISYGIIEEHGGSIDCDSAPGEHTTFTLKLPI